MNRAWWGKLFLLVLVTVLALAYVTPTVLRLDPETSKFPVKQKVNLGLDLQGGLYLVLGIDFPRYFKELAERQANSLKEDALGKGITLGASTVVVDPTTPDQPKITVKVPAEKREALKALIRERFWTLQIFADASASDPTAMELGLSREYRSDQHDKIVDQSIQVIRNRIDEFGVSEPSITSQGSDRVVVELPGVKEVDRAKELIGKTAKLEFRIVNSTVDPGQVAELVARAEKDRGISYKEGGKFSEYVKAVNEALQGKIPADSEVAFERPGGRGGEPAGADTPRVPYLIFRKADVTGDDLADAHVAINQENRRPYVSFSLNPKGASVFEKLTGDNIGKGLAIVLDGIIHSAPRINGRIGASGMIELGMGDPDKLMKEARDLSIVLRAGALPAQLEFLEERVIGPTLGADSIRRGATSGIVGCLAVFLFMILYYRGSGAVAVFSLILNGTFILAILVGLEATLTLPGIAGIALTIGMAVDSNVLIFERIRDELYEGKTPRAAVEAGFQKAFTAIFDANLTHGIVATILMMYGSGPIRGFAISLMIGIFTTLFCAVTVCKLLFDGWLGSRTTEPTAISI